MALLVLLAMVIGSLAGCTTSTTVTSNKSTITVIQHTQSFTIAPGQTAMGTASCASGEALLSGGYLVIGSLPQGHFGAVDSYPSDSSGNLPASQGAIEDSWTVRIHNTSASQKTYLVSANCASGYPIATAVWSAPIHIKDGIGAGGSVQCPNSPTNVLVGGGYSYSPNDDVPIAWLGPAYAYGSDQTWDVVTIGVAAAGIAFAVCAKGIFDEPLVMQQNYAGYPPGNPVNPSGKVACSEGEVLTGGGFGVNDIDFWNTPLTINTLALGSSPQWQAALHSDGAAGAVPPDFTLGICTTLKWNGDVPITFSNYHHLIRIPADSIIVATDGSGQVKAAPTTVHMTRVASNPIAATKTINPFTGGVSYSVPAGCGSPTPAIDAATTALKDKLKGLALPSGQIAFGSPAISINRGSLTCAPAAGTQRTAPFTFTQMIDGSATQASYDPHEIVKYQYSQLQRAAQQLGSPYVLRDTLICPEGPKLVSATSTRATVECSAYGVAEWPFSADQLRALAQKLAGKSKAEAMAILDATPGIEPGSETFNHLQGDTLPNKADDITIIIVRTQDTAPVFRAP
jgi:hypothetical protein